MALCPNGMDAEICPSYFPCLETGYCRSILETLNIDEIQGLPFVTANIIIDLHICLYVCKVKQTKPQDSS